MPISRFLLPGCLLAVACSGDDGLVAGSTSTGGSSTGEPPDTTAMPTDPGEDPTPTATDASTGADPDVSTGVSFLCGDGLVEPGEGCDDGAANGPFAACTGQCQVNVCGDGFVYLGVEGCDEGANNSDVGYCRSDCELGVCGDGFVLVGVEACDAGAASSDAYGACDAACTVNHCGDGELDVGFEECDAGPDNGTGRGGELGKAGCDLECGLAGRRLFLSSQLFNGAMETRAGADLACQNMAAGAEYKHPERFRALLADAEADPWDFVAEDVMGRPFILPSGLIVAESYAALIEGGPGEGITMTEAGESFYDWKVWTNLNPAGTAYLKEGASTCDAWTSDGPALSARTGRNTAPPGDALAAAKWKAGKHWLSFQSLACAKLARIYCIEAS